MDEQKILIPEKVEIKIYDKSYKVGALTLNQILKLGKLLATTLFSSKSKLQALSEKAKENRSNAEDLMSILDLLEEDDIASLFSIILKEDDKEFIKANLPFDKAIEIIAVLCEYNKFDGVKKNFKKILDALQSVPKDE